MMPARRWGGGQAKMRGMEEGVQSIWGATVCDRVSGKIYCKRAGDSLWVHAWTSSSSYWYLWEKKPHTLQKLDSMCEKCQNVTSEWRLSETLTGEEKETITGGINTKKKCVGAQRDSVPLGAVTQGGWGGRLGRLHNVGPLKRLSRGKYGWRQQRGYKWDVVAEVGAAVWRSTAQLWLTVMTGPTGKWTHKLCGR